MVQAPVQHIMPIKMVVCKVWCVTIQFDSHEEPAWNMKEHTPGTAAVATVMDRIASDHASRMLTRLPASNRTKIWIEKHSTGIIT